jgi:hypothetical protein
MHLYDYLKDCLSGPLAASLVSIAALWGLNSILPRETISWPVMLIISAAVVMASFTAISLRKETADLIVTVRKKYECKKERRI